MKHFTNAKFWVAYQALPPKVQRLADKNFQLMKADPRHPSIQLKKVDASGQRVSATITALSRSNMTADCCGFGLAVTRSTTTC